MKNLTKILFVDDDPDILTVAKYCFEGIDDLEVRFLNSGEDAVKETLSFNPDLILLDVMMPKMDGVATYKAIRFIPKLAAIPIVFITAKLQENEIENYLKLGIADVIKKPFDPLTIRDHIENIWHRTQKVK